MAPSRHQFRLAYDFDQLGYNDDLKSAIESVLLKLNGLIDSKKKPNNNAT